jgi:hypothetical protein
MKKFLVFMIPAFLLTTVGCSNPNGQRITEKNKEVFLKNWEDSELLRETISKEIKRFKTLPKEDSDSLIYYLARYALKEKYGADTKNDLPLVGRTVGELIDLQKQWDKKQGGTPYMNFFVEQVRAEDAARTNELRKNISLTVTNKGFLPIDATVPRIEPLITFLFVCQNTSQKDIRAFQGELIFLDLFGDEIQRLAIKRMDPVKVGEKASWKGHVKYSELTNEGERLKNIDLKNLKVVWEPKEIIFVDGSTMPKEKSLNDGKTPRRKP